MVIKCSRCKTETANYCFDHANENEISLVSLFFNPENNTLQSVVSLHFTYCQKNVKHSDKTDKSDGTRVMYVRTKTASLSSKTNCYEVRNCHLKYDVKKRELDYLKWHRKCRRSPVYPSSTGDYVLRSPNVERRSNAIIFLPNTNLNNIRVMSLISVFFMIIIIIIFFFFSRQYV